MPQGTGAKLEGVTNVPLGEEGALQEHRQRLLEAIVEVDDDASPGSLLPKGHWRIDLTHAAGRQTVAAVGLGLLGRATPGSDRELLRPQRHHRIDAAGPHRRR